MRLLGFNISRDTKNKNNIDVENKTFSPPENTDGAVVVQSGSYYGTYVDMEGSIRTESELITRYRDMSVQPEIETAIDEIVNEAIVNDTSGQSVEINLDELKLPDTIKMKINTEFKNILKL